MPVPGSCPLGLSCLVDRLNDFALEPVDMGGRMRRYTGFPNALVLDERIALGAFQLAALLA